MKRIIDIKKRTLNAVTHNIEKLISKYGFEETRVIAHKIFKEKTKKQVLQKEIKEAEAILADMKKQEKK